LDESTNKMEPNNKQYPIHLYLNRTVCHFEVDLRVSGVVWNIKKHSVCL